MQKKSCIQQLNLPIEDKRNTENPQQNAPTPIASITPITTTTPITTINITEKKQNNTVIYPNPTTSLIYFDNIDKKIVNLYASNGKLLQVTRNNYLDLSKYPAGLYYLELNNTAIKVLKE